jgi:hypothetical protein
VYWTDQFGSAGSDEASAVATASNGDVVVYGAGGSVIPGYSVGGTNDLILAKYNRAGDRKWVVQFGTEQTDFSSRTIALASNGDIVVAGTTLGAFPGYTLQGSTDVFVARFNRNGKKLWVKQLGAPGTELAGAVALAPTGEIYLALTTNGAFPNGSAPPTQTYGGADAVLTKLDRKGNLVWSRSIGTADADYGFGVAVSRKNDVYFVGAVSGLVEDGGNYGGSDDAFVSRFDRNGNRTWLYQSGDTGSDEFLAAATNAQGDLYAAGGTEALAGGTVDGFKYIQGTQDGMVIKVSRGGVVRWANEHGSVGADEDTSIAVARNGQVYVAGQTDDAWAGFTSKGGIDAYVAHLTPDGSSVTTRQVGTAGDDSNGTLGVGVAVSGNSTVVLASSVDSASIWGHESAGDFDAYVGAIPAP